MSARETLRAKLAQTHDEIRKAIEELPAQTTRFDSASMGAEMERRDKVVKKINRLDEQLRGINLALQKVENGTYGICHNCGNSISPARLDAIPWAILCITCKEKQDR